MSLYTQPKYAETEQSLLSMSNREALLWNQGKQAEVLEMWTAHPDPLTLRSAWSLSGTRWAAGRHRDTGKLPLSQVLSVGMLPRLRA